MSMLGRLGAMAIHALLTVLCLEIWAQNPTGPSVGLWAAGLNGVFLALHGAELLHQVRRARR